MTLPISYQGLLLTALACILLLSLLWLFRRRFSGPATRLRTVLSRHDPEYRQEEIDYLAPLLVYEESYPAFADILGLVLSRFPVRKLLRNRSLREALQFLAEAACRPSESRQVEAAMCQAVRSLLQDPDVEYYCRPELSLMIDRFLEQINSDQQTRQSNTR